MKSATEQLLALTNEHPRSPCEEGLISLCAALIADIQELKSDVASLEYQVQRKAVEKTR